MKVLTVVGTRPEVIRLSRIIEKLDQFSDHILVHTGQNYDRNLKDVFFEQLGVRQPDHYLGARGTFAEQIGIILVGVERIIREEKPDKFLVLGDTNSAIGVIVAKRLHIPIYHMEAGNRCYDDRVPEEVNRRIIDHSSDILMPYTQNSKQNLLAEGIPPNRIYVTGNPINEVIQHYQPQIEKATILADLGLKEQGYFLVTMHREENVDIEERLVELTRGLSALAEKYQMPVIISTHPRTRKRMAEFDVLPGNSNLRFMDPFPFFEFIALERSAFCVLSDSGTVQEECSIFGVPNVTLRDVTERPETLECGSNMLSGAQLENVLHCVETVLGGKGDWTPPNEYIAENVSRTVVKLVTGFLHRTA
jgi:UDP-N-acetylglucosamine 2-epimerase (non-hydrolysing)